MTYFIFYLSGFLIFWAMIGYPIVIKLLGLIIKKENKRDYSYQPTVTVMVVAHNEEKVIEQKLNNLMQLKYPKEKLKILVASDNSSDDTNLIVKNFIKKEPEIDTRLYVTKNRAGKTNAQNEAQKTINSEYIVFTDANAMLAPNAVKELMSVFNDETIIYATGQLIYTNSDVSEASASETTYWSTEIKIREIESRLQTITAGNGAIYAIRNRDYIDLPPIRSHDAGIPFHAAINQKRSVSVSNAMAFEKAGETIGDEFKRKVRMNRGILPCIIRSLNIINVFKYKWFTFFYIGHRTSRCLLWLNHLLLLITSLKLADTNIIFKIFFILQIIFYSLALIQKKIGSNNKLLQLIYYYSMTITAQFIGVYNGLIGKNKPFWDKAETTR